MWAYGLLALLCAGAAVAHAFYPERITETTALLLGMAGLALVLPNIRKLKWGDNELLLDEVREDVKEVAKALEAIEQTQPGRPGAPASSPSPALPQLAGSEHAHDSTTESEVWASDPNKGRFGGSPRANNRVLEATISPVGRKSAACRVRLRVRSTDPDRHPLEGEVRLHLHPTFGRWREYRLTVVDGVAQDTITSWGRFTVGAVSDGGKTRLELDLHDVPGGTPRFYEN